MTSAEPTTSTSARWRRGRRTLVAVAVALAAIALVVDPIARDTLSGGRAIDLGLLQLRLTYNTGVAFSLGDQLPTAVVLAATAAITATISVFAWRTAPDSHPIQTVGLAAIVAGAAANVIDRLLDAKVTDYFHTGWFATFNLADTYITCGVVLVIGALLLESNEEHAP
ncbi:signal peptidase II [Rhodococcus ruber]|jgi:signal peptidase II|uniref:signal peptidase II n=1 Tax=Rhodococcus ruber TaxID=1830 RepID=UPI001EEE7AC2|nr:signal peptidase II [Rhodococcus ruber]MCF8786102.1 signal peptidase II [Rhodococcus ruber]